MKIKYFVITYPPEFLGGKAAEFEDSLREALAEIIPQEVEVRFAPDDESATAFASAVADRLVRPDDDAVLAVDAVVRDVYRDILDDIAAEERLAAMQRKYEASYASQFGEE